MGIYDREYYRDETSGSGWFSGVAPMCRLIILINVGVFLAIWVLSNGDPDTPLVRLLEANSSRIFHGYVWQLLTATFVHQDIFHILWNMLFLWFVGREMESFYGSRDFLVMYLSAAVISTLGWALVDYFWLSHGVATMIGASGAVTTVVVLYTLYYPNREILLFFLLPVPMWLLLVIFLGSDLLSLIRELQGGMSMGTAFASHLTGAGYGFLFKRFDLRWSQLAKHRPFRPRLRVFSEPRDKTIPFPTSSPGRSTASTSASKQAPMGVSPEDEDQFAARLDEILAKIAREGREALTEEEHRILQEASRRARSRRSDRV